MARQPRKAIDGGLYHVLNRGNCRMDIFTKPGDFQSFLKLLEQGRQRFDMRICGYCLMDNHWHMVLWPRRGEDLSRFMGWVSTTHVRRWREHRDKVGEGHLYQGRFKSFLVQPGEHFLTVMRYVEANPLRAGMVQQAQAWPWSSLGRAAGSDQTKVQLADWPTPKPRNWLALINASLDAAMLSRLHTHIARNRPFGDNQWTTRTARRYGMESTLRNPWRPSKAKGKEQA